MEWLLYLLCPLMMLLCMKGMFLGGKKECNTKQSLTSFDEMKSLQTQIQNLQEQNNKLMEEMQSMKQINSSKVIPISSKNEKEQKLSS
ncbi:MAG: hypothetical protein U9Q88_15830 [Bacillota bacterium]|nr:hypothetical protein [Bacillota bacterium]